MTILNTSEAGILISSEIVNIENSSVPVTFTKFTGNQNPRLITADAKETRTHIRKELSVPYENCSKEIRDLRDAEVYFFEVKNKLVAKEKTTGLTEDDLKTKALLLVMLKNNNLDWNFKKLPSSE